MSVNQFFLEVDGINYKWDVDELTDEILVEGLYPFHAETMQEMADIIRLQVWMFQR